MHFIGPLKPISLTVKSGPTGFVRAPGDRVFLSSDSQPTVSFVLCPRVPREEMNQC